MVARAATVRRSSGMGGLLPPHSALTQSTCQKCDTQQASRQVGRLLSAATTAEALSRPSAEATARANANAYANAKADADADADADANANIRAKVAAKARDREGEAKTERPRLLLLIICM